jgi:hypothetical protein
MLREVPALKDEVTHQHKLAIQILFFVAVTTVVYLGGIFFDLNICLRDRWYRAV